MNQDEFFTLSETKVTWLDSKIGLKPFTLRLYLNST